MGTKEERALEAEAAAEAHQAELAKVDGWGVREILHHLLDLAYVPHYARAGGPTEAAVRQAVDDAHHYQPPEPALTPEETQQLDALLAKQRQADEAAAAKKAGVEHTDDT